MFKLVVFGTYQESLGALTIFTIYHVQSKGCGETIGAFGFRIPEKEIFMYPTWQSTDPTPLSARRTAIFFSANEDCISANHMARILIWRRISLTSRKHLQYVYAHVHVRTMYLKYAPYDWLKYWGMAILVCRKKIADGHHANQNHSLNSVELYDWGILSGFNNRVYMYHTHIPMVDKNKYKNN